MDSQFLSGVLSTTGLFAVAISVIKYISDKKKNNALAMKTTAEANAIEFKTANDGWQHLVETLQKIQEGERKHFDMLLNAERKECDDKLLAMQSQINVLKQKLNN